RPGLYRSKAKDRNKGGIADQGCRAIRLHPSDTRGSARDRAGNNPSNFRTANNLRAQWPIAVRINTAPIASSSLCVLRLRRAADARRSAKLPYRFVVSCEDSLRCNAI